MHKIILLADRGCRAPIGAFVPVSAVEFFTPFRG
jgi:hypothetical protein